MRRRYYLIKLFKNIFTPRSTETSTDSLFADWDLISYELLMDHFNVKEEATERGKNNAPATAASTPDDFHNSLVVRYQKLIATRVKEISSRFEGLETRADKAIESINFLNDAKTKFTNEIDIQLENYEPIITDANSRVRSLKEEVNEFKAKNNLTRDASYPDSKLWYYFLLFALLGFESFINGTLFASGSAQGIFGGWSIAVLISAVNVIFGFMVGAFWGKQAWSIHQPLKTIGIIGFLLWGAFTAVFNLSVGHIRSIYEEGNIGLDSNPWTEGFVNFLNNPIGLVDFTSWVLVFIGILFAIIALFDGIRIDDKYPGYGSIVRKLKDIQAELHQEVDDLKESANELYDYYLNTGDEAIKKLGQDSVELREGHDFIKERVRNEYPKYCSYYSDNFRRLIGSYRNYNLEARSDEAPAYFKEEIPFNWDTDNRDDQLASLSSKIDSIGTKLSEQTNLWASNRKELEDIKISFLNKIRSYDSIS